MPRKTENKNIKKKNLILKIYQLFKTNKPFTITFILLLITTSLLGIHYGQVVKTAAKEITQAYISEKAVQVHFKDPNLEAEVRKTLEKSMGNVYDKDLATIGVLKIQNVMIKNIHELQYFTGLSELEISSSKIYDLSPLKGLEKLKNLDLSNNIIMDVQPLSSCKNLEKVNLSGNAIMDISPLYQLKHVVDLNVSKNTIYHINNDIQKMENLKNLNLTRNRITDTSVFSNMSQLNILHLTHNKITEIKPMLGMDSLLELSVENNAIEEVKHLGEVPKLEKLSLAVNKIKTIDFANKIPWLLELSVSENDISSIDLLKNNPFLQSLKIQYTRVDDISVLRSLKNFNSIYVDPAFNREKIKAVMKRDGKWQFRNGDIITKQYVLNNQYDLKLRKVSSWK